MKQTKHCNKLHNTISSILQNKFNKTLQESKLTNSREGSLMIYTIIFDSIVEIIKTSNVQLTNESTNYIAQMYYDSISINSTGDGLDPNIFTQRASLKNIDTKEIALLALMFTQTPFCIPMIAEIKHRS